jgi:hypothetical protein
MFVVIQYLDEDPDLPSTNFNHIDESYPEVKACLDYHNRRLMISSYLLAVSFILNGGLSAHVIIGSYNDGFRSTLGLITNCSLVLFDIVSVFMHDNARGLSMSGRHWTLKFQ